MTRRKMMATVVAAPLLATTVSSAFANGPSLVAIPLSVANRIEELTREFNPSGGDLGRADWNNRPSIEEAISLVPTMMAMGFKRPTVHTQKYYPIYSAFGAPVAIVWHCFAREINGRNEIISFEHTMKETSEFKVRTGQSYVDAFRRAEENRTKATT